MKISKFNTQETCTCNKFKKKKGKFNERENYVAKRRGIIEKQDLAQREGGQIFEHLQRRHLMYNPKLDSNPCH